MTKKELRQYYKSVRNSIDVHEKADSDKCILSAFINSLVYRNADLLLIYASFGSEADTLSIIDCSLKDGKRVAVPYCNEKTMDFYEIFSTDELSEGKFGILTVIPDTKRLIKNYDKALCVVPALSFDASGNRLGYGGGYYDRFLCGKNITKIGICYESCISSFLPSEEHDIKIDYLLTENRLAKI